MERKYWYQRSGESRAIHGDLFVLFFISGMTGLIPGHGRVLSGAVGGAWRDSVHSLFSKTQKFGLVTMMGILMGLITF